MLSLVGVHYHFRLTSVHFVKFTKQILAGVPPPFWQCQDFESACYPNPSLTEAPQTLMYTEQYTYSEVYISRSLQLPDHCIILRSVVLEHVPSGQ